MVVAVVAHHHFLLCPGSLLVLRVEGSAQEAVLLHQRLEGNHLQIEWIGTKIR